MTDEQIINEYRCYACEFTRKVWEAGDIGQLEIIAKYAAACINELSAKEERKKDETKV